VSQADSALWCGQCGAERAGADHSACTGRAELDPDEVPLNFLNPRPGTPFGDLPVMTGPDALRTIAAFRLALPRTILRYAGGREITLGDLGTRDGMLGGINAVIVGNYLTTLGRSPEEDLGLLGDLGMPVKALSQTI